MKAIRITTDDTIVIVDAPDGFSSIREILGNVTLEFVKPMYSDQPDIAFAVDDMGLYRELPVNKAASLMYGTQFHGNPIVGDVAVIRSGFDSCGCPDYLLLDDRQAESYRDGLLREFPFLKTA